MQLGSIIEKIASLRFMRRKRSIFLLALTCTILTMVVNVYIVHGYVPIQLLVWSDWIYGGRTLVYPVNGTGETLNISCDFDPGVFNSFCKATHKFSAVLPVYSDVENFKARMTLRDTLGKVAKRLNCKIFFISGVSSKDSVNDIIREEYVRERDILIVPKIDTFRHLNNKAFAMIEWISNHCAHVPYVIHLTDDVYINLKQFLHRLKTIREPYFILGKVNHRIPVPRDTTLKHHVTFREYPMSWFPDHVAGFAYAFPSRVSARLLSVIHAAMYCWLEDVWVTGHLRQAAGVNLVSLKDTEWTTAGNVSVTATSKKALLQYMFVHSLDPDLYSKLYSIALQ